MKRSRQTVTQTPWEVSQNIVDREEKVQARRIMMRKIKRTTDAERCAASAEFNKAHGFTSKIADPKAKFLRGARNAFGSRRPISLAKIKGSKDE